MDPRPRRSSCAQPRRVGITAPAAEAAGNINPDTPSSLTINKYDGPQGPRGDGTKIDDTSGLGTPLRGVEFTIRKVLTANGEDVNLDTEAGWNAIDGVVVADVLDGTGFTFGPEIKVLTGADGTVTQDLDHGLYVVEETDPGPNNIVSPAQRSSSPCRCRSPAASGSTTSTSTRRTRRTRPPRRRKSRIRASSSSGPTSPGRSRTGSGQGRRRHLPVVHHHRQPRPATDV